MTEHIKALTGTTVFASFDEWVRHHEELYLREGFECGTFTTFANNVRRWMPRSIANVPNDQLLSAIEKHHMWLFQVRGRFYVLTRSGFLTDNPVGSRDLMAEIRQFCPHRFSLVARRCSVRQLSAYHQTNCQDIVWSAEHAHTTLKATDRDGVTLFTIVRAKAVQES